MTWFELSFKDEVSAAESAHFLHVLCFRDVCCGVTLALFARWLGGRNGRDAHCGLCDCHLRFSDVAGMRNLSTYA